MGKELFGTEGGSQMTGSVVAHEEESVGNVEENLANLKKIRVGTPFGISLHIDGEEQITEHRYGFGEVEAVSFSNEEEKKVFIEKIEAQIAEAQANDKKVLLDVEA